MGKDRLKVLIALLMAAMLLMAACGDDDDGTDTSGGDGQETEAPALEVVNEGRLTVGSDIPYPPFEFEEGGELTGFDADLVFEIAGRIGLENEASDWISTDFGAIFQQLQSGNRFDIVVAAVTGYAPEGSPASEVVAERTALIDFTDPYYPSLQSLAVNVDETPDIDSVDALPEGARVAVQSGTTGAFFAQENLTGAELVNFDKAPQMYQQLQAGQVDGVFSDLPTAVDAIEGIPGLEVVEQVETGEEYAIAVSKENPELKEAINGALAEMFEDGTYTEIFRKYFPDQELPPYASE